MDIRWSLISKTHRAYDENRKSVYSMGMKGISFQIKAMRICFQKRGNRKFNLVAMELFVFPLSPRYIWIYLIYSHLRIARQK